MLGRVQAGELNNAAAAKALGIKVGAWGVWKSNYQKRAGGAKPAARRCRPPGSARRDRPPGKATTRASAPSSSLAGVVEQREGLRRFGEKLRERVREMVELVEQKFPGR